ncbi:MAG: hypothetical protein J6V04_02500, partial [Bacteroidales bacterium]|nr:hypothetical protein [Bacteroidales bacterium]
MLEIEYMVILVVFGLIVLAPYVLWCLRLWFFKKHKLDWYLVNGRWVTWGVLGFIVSVPIVFFSVVALCFSSNYHTRNLVNEDHLYEKVIEEQNDTVRLVKVDELGNYEVIVEAEDCGGELHPQEDPSLLWAIYYHYIDPGNQHMSASHTGRWISALIAVIGVVLVNGLMVSVFVNLFERRKDNYQKGQARYKGLFKRGGHSVIIGGSDLVLNLVKELLSKSSQGKGKRHSYILIQTSSDVEKFRHKLFSLVDQKYHQYIIIYQGDRTSDDDVNDLYVNEASQVYIIGESLDVDGQNHDAYNMEAIDFVAQSISGAKCSKESCSVESDKNSSEDTRKKVFVLFENQMTFSVFQFSDLCSTHKALINFIPLNYYEMWAQKVFAHSDPTGLLYGENEKFYSPLDMIPQRDEVKQDNVKGEDSDKGPDTSLRFISDSAEDKHYVHLVVIGMSKMGVAMGLEAAHIAHYPNCLTADAPRTRITFIDENADRESGYIRNRYDALFGLSRWRYADFSDSEADIDKVEWKEYDLLKDKECRRDYLSSNNFDLKRAGDEFFIDVEWEFIKGNLSCDAVQEYLRRSSDKSKDQYKILTVAVCLDEPHQAIAGGLYLPESVYENALQILVYQRHSGSIVRNVYDSANDMMLDKEGNPKNSSRYKNVKPFGMLSETFSLMFTDDSLPKWINYVYWNKDKYDLSDARFSVDVEDNWNEQTLGFENGKSGCAARWSNIYNANAILTKLRSAGLSKEDCERIARERKESYKDVSSSSIVEWVKFRQKIAAMAMTEHKRWNTEQLLMHYRPVTVEQQIELIAKNKGDVKQMKNRLKRTQMRHLDVCAFNRLEEVDKGIGDYDVKISMALPFIVERFGVKK